jgi:hypothetical protein
MKASLCRTVIRLMVFSTIICSTALAADPSQATTQPASPEDRLRQLEAENADLRQQVADLKAQLNASSRPPSLVGGTKEGGLSAQLPVSVKLLDKGFHKMDAMAGDGGDSVTISLEFKNNTGRDIKAMQGLVVFKDQFGDAIQSVKIKCEDSIAAGQSTRWDGAVNFNQFIDSDRRLAEVDKGTVHTDLQVQKIIFSDGSVQDFPQQN